MSKNQAIQKLLHKSGLCIRKYSPVALSFVASAGVVVTAIAAAKATPRAVALVYADSRKGMMVIHMRTPRKRRSLLHGNVIFRQWHLELLLLLALWVPTP